MHADHVIAGLAQRQHGLLTVEQAVAAGLKYRQLQHRVATGQLVAVRKHVLRIAGAPRSWRQSALTAVLAGGPETVLSHAAAARLWKLERFATSDVEITEPMGCSADLDGVRSHHSKIVLLDRRLNHAIPVTSPERTVIDLSGRYDAKRLGRIADDAIRQKLMTAEGLAVCAARLRPAPGRRMSAVHGVLESRLPGYQPGDSDFCERVAQVLEHVAQLPDVVRQHPVRVGQRTYHIDIANSSVLLAHEADGWASHRTRTAFYVDRARANDLVALGWTVLRYTYDMTDAEIAAVARATYDRLVRAQAS